MHKGNDFPSLLSSTKEKIYIPKRKSQEKTDRKENKQNQLLWFDPANFYINCIFFSNSQGKKAFVSDMFNM